MLLLHGGVECLAQVADHRLNRDQQIAVRRAHHHGEDAGQGQPRQAGGQDLDGQGRYHGIGGAELLHHVGQDLLGRQPHQEQQGDGHAIDGGAPEHAPLGRLFILGREGPLPHLRPRHGEHQIGDDVPQYLAVNGRGDVALVQAGPEAPEAPQIVQTGKWDHQVDKDNKHEKLHHIGVHHAEQSGGGGIDDEDGGGDKSPHLVADAHLSPQQLNNGSGGGDLGGHRAHHGESHHSSQDAFSRLSEAVLEQAGDGLDVVLLPHLLNTPGVAGEDKHAQHIGQGGGNGHEARGVGDARPSHHGAASDNGGTHGGG